MMKTFPTVHRMFGYMSMYICWRIHMRISPEFRYSIIWLHFLLQTTCCQSVINFTDLSRYLTFGLRKTFLDGEWNSTRVKFPPAHIRLLIDAYVLDVEVNMRNNRKIMEVVHLPLSVDYYITCRKLGFITIPKSYLFLERRHLKMIASRLLYA